MPEPSDVVVVPAWWVLAGLGFQALTLTLTVFIAYHKAVIWLGARLSAFESSLAQHALQLTSGVEQIHGLASRMEKTEERHVELAGVLQRLIGRVESWNGTERRQRGPGG
jgi:hypothetical protein